MILSCPNCGTQYVVKDGAIPPEGRQVRCAACKHSWHQDPENAAEPETATEVEADRTFPNEAAEETAPELSSDGTGHAEEADQAPPDEDESLAEATLIEPRSGPEAEQRAYDEAVIEDGVTKDTPSAVGYISAEAPVEPAAKTSDWNEPPTAEAVPDTFSPFAEDSEVERRRSPVAAVLVILLIIVVAAALFWFLAPVTLKAKLGITPAAATPLQLVTTHMDRTPLESGNELLTVTGRVINPSAKEQDVPPIQAQLKDHQGKVVYSWTIQPPAHSLSAGASASFNSAEVNVPPGGDELTITLGEPKG